MLTVNGKTIEPVDCTRWVVRGMTPCCRMGLDVSRCSDCTEQEPRHGNWTNPPVYELPVVTATPATPPPSAPARMRGLGDVIARATTAIGIKPCGGCKKRQEALNKAVPFGKPKE
jgi:hypothetical protein